MKLLQDLDVLGKRVLLRADLDVDIAQDGATTHKERATGSESEKYPTRLLNIKATVDSLLASGASSVVILGHMDRPKGPDPKLSTSQLVGPLSEILGRKIEFRDQLSETRDQRPGTRDQNSVARDQGLETRDQGPGTRDQEDKIVLFENLRFWPGETENSAEFAKQLAGLGDVYVNDAFGNCHREHASMVVLPMLLPSAAGINLEKEVSTIRKVLENPERPFIAVIGGVKIETKLPAIANLAGKADKVLVGGLMAPQYDPGAVDEKFRERVVVAVLTKDTEDIEDYSIAKFESILQGAKTVVWNGPLSHFEKGFVRGTAAIAEAIIESGAECIVGGGQTEEFLAKNDLLSKFSFVSSGGGAMLELLAGKTLPALKALE